MNLKVLPIDFLGQGAMLEPKDRELHDMAVDYCNRELQNGHEVNLSKFSKVWVVVEMEGTTYKKVVGLSGWVWRVDIPIFRVTGEAVDRATMMLTERIRSYMEDQGARDSEVFIHLSSKETPEQKCKNWDKSLALVGAVPADRYAVKV
ncbi:MAG TPA: hypothetical protein VN517_16250 [Terriglobales bacterium]|nr:hypothetical protein [Terriglobales bacterium]